MKTIKTKRKRLSKKFRRFLKKNKLESVYHALRASEGTSDYFGFSKTDISRIGYLKNGRIPDKSHLIWDEEYRARMGFHAKPGKLLSELVPNSDIQKISAILYNMKLKEELGARLFLTSDICYWYLEDRYSEYFGRRGGLWGSCMKYSECQEGIELYETFGKDVVELLVLVDKNNELLGRALFWKKVNTSQGTTQYLDRIYAVNDNVKQMFLDWTEAKNIPSYDTDIPSGEMRINNINVREYDRIPYFDTFHYYDYDTLSSKHGDISFDSTECPRFEDLDTQRCDDCGCRVHRERLYYSSSYGGNLCDDCGIWTNDDWHHINDCVQIKGEYYHKDSDDIRYSNYRGEYYFTNDCVYSEYHDDWIEMDNSVYSEEEKDYFRTDDVDEIIFCASDNEYYLHDSESVVEIDGDFYLKSDLIEIKGKYYTEDSPHIYYDEEEGEHKLRQMELA